VDPLTGVTTAAEPWCTSCGYPPSMCDPYYTRCRETIIGPWVDENGVYHESTTSAPNTEDLGECLPLARTHEVRDDPMDNMYDDDLSDDDLYDDDDDKKKIVRRGKCKDEIRNNNKFKDPPPPPPPQAMSVRSKYDDDDDDKKKIVRRGKCKDEIRNNNKFKDPPPPPPPPQAMSVRSK